MTKLAVYTRDHKQRLHTYTQAANGNREESVTQLKPVTLHTPQVVDGGTYSCSAENSAGTDTHSARLNVYGPPQVRPMGQQTAVAGRTFVVACPASGHPIHAITWTKGERGTG